MVSKKMSHDIATRKFKKNHGNCGSLCVGSCLLGREDEAVAVEVAWRRRAAQKRCLQRWEIFFFLPEVHPRVRGDPYNKTLSYYSDRREKRRHQKAYMQHSFSTAK